MSDKGKPWSLFKKKDEKKSQEDGDGPGKGGKTKGWKVKGWMAKLRGKKTADDEAAVMQPGLAAASTETSTSEGVIISLLEGYKLQGGSTIADVIMAKSEGRLLGGLGDSGVLDVTWYRCDPKTNEFFELKGVQDGYYQPSVDDITCRILCKVEDLARPGNSRFSECGPLSIDEQLQAEFQKALEDKELELTVEDGENWGEMVKCKFTEAEITVTKESDEDNPMAFPTKGTTVKLNPAEHKECSLKPPSAPKVRMRVVTPSHRNLIALLVRYWNERVNEYGEPLEAEEEEEQEEEETSREGREEEEEEDAGAGSTAQEMKMGQEGKEGDKKSDNALESRESEANTADHAEAVESNAVASLRNRVSELAKSLQEKDDRISKLSKALQDEVLQREKSEREYQMALDERDEMQARMQTSKQETRFISEKLGSADTEIAKLKDEVTILQEEKGKLEKTERELNIKIQNMEADSKAAELQQQQKMQQQAEEKVQELQQEMEQLRAELKASQGEHASVLAELKDVKANSQFAQNSLLESNTEKESLSLENRELHRQVRDLKEEVDNLKKEVEAHKARADTMAMENRDMKHQISDAKQQSSSYQNTMKALEEDLNKASNEREEAKGQSAALENRVKELEKCEGQVEQAQRKAKEAEEELDKVVSERNAARRKLASLQKDMGRMLQGDASVDDIEELRTSQKELQTRVKILEAENKRLMDELDSASPVGSSSSASQKAPVKTTPSGFGSKSPGYTPPPPRVPRRAVGMGLSSVGGTGGLKSSGSASQDVLVKQNVELQRLANELADQLSDKEEALKQQRVTKNLLAQRIQELEAKLQDKKQLC